MGSQDQGIRPKATASAHNPLTPNVDFADAAEGTATGAHALILLTERGDIVRADWAAMADQMLPPRYVLDGRNALDADVMFGLGFEYTGVGRGDAERAYTIGDVQNSSKLVPVEPPHVIPAFR